MIEAAKANVVGPAVAADQPDALAGEGVGYSEQGTGGGAVDAGKLRTERQDAFALGFDAGFGGLVGREEGRDEFIAKGCGKGREEDFGVLLLLVESEPNAETELGVVFEEGVRPGWTAAGLVDRVGRCGQAAAID